MLKIILNCFLAALLLLTIGCGPIKVTVTNAPLGGLEHGVMATDGFTDRIKTGYVTANQTFEVGPFQGNGELFGFARARPMAHTNVTPWPNNGSVVTLPFPTEVAIPVTYWVVQGPFNTQRDRILTHIATTAGIWNSERMGLAFTNTRIVDATDDPQRTNYLAFDCGEQSGIQTDIGRDSARVNVYYVNTVEVNGSPGTGNGNACSIGSDFVAMGSASGVELLVHELGHTFALTHIDDLSTFNATGIMFSASNTRQFISEGETFRAQLTPNSAINDTYGLRAGQITRNCLRDTWDRNCLNINKRMWADGAFPAN